MWKPVCGIQWNQKMERCWNSESLLEYPLQTMSLYVEQEGSSILDLLFKNSTVLKILSVFVIAKNFSYPNFFSAIRNTK